MPSPAITHQDQHSGKIPEQKSKALLDKLAAKINAVGSGTEILHTETDAEQTYGQEYNRKL